MQRTDCLEVTGVEEDYQADVPANRSELTSWIFHRDKTRTVADWWVAVKEMVGGNKVRLLLHINYELTEALTLLNIPCIKCTGIKFQEINEESFRCKRLVIW